MQDRDLLECSLAQSQLRPAAPPADRCSAELTGQVSARQAGIVLTGKSPAATGSNNADPSTVEPE
ncbi:MAG: hypothetical protein ACRDSH_20395 [Pseudonocardiaceae bacterium]